MGTIYNQSPRRDLLKEDQVITFANMIAIIAEKSKISYLEALETYRVFALINDYDAKDEQISGLAQIIETLIKG